MPNIYVFLGGPFLDVINLFALLVVIVLSDRASQEGSKKNNANMFLRCNSTLLNQCIFSMAFELFPFKVMIVFIISMCSHKCVVIISEIPSLFADIQKLYNLLKNDIYFFMGDSRFYRNLVNLVPIFLKFHTLIVILNRDIWYFCVEI